MRATLRPGRGSKLGSAAGPTLRVALGVVILIDVLRVFLPSLITIFGQAGGTPAELIGLYALAWFLGGFVAVALARVIGARLIGVIGAVALVVGRAALQFTDGGGGQLYVASGALLAGLCWLTATAMTHRDARPVASGLVWGLAIATAGHAALDTIDLVWRTGPIAVLLLVIELVAFLAVAWRTGAAPVESAASSAVEGATEGAAGVAGSAGPARFWLAVGPALLLWGLFTGNSAHAQATAGWSALPAAAVVVVACFLATAVVTHPRAFTGHPIVAGIGLVLGAVAFGYGEVTVAGVHGVAPWWTVIGQVLGALALAGCLGFAAQPRPNAVVDRPYRRGLLLATGFLLFVVFVFAYYAAYDLFLVNDFVPAAVAAIVALVAGLGTRPAPATGHLGRATARAVAAAVVGVLAVAAVPLWQPAASAGNAPADGLRVAAYNIRMGFGLSGTMTVPEQAETLRALGAHVIVLSEVDRAWFLNGGHDDLRLIADRLGMRYVWAPATDEVWGDALLTNLPITSIRNHVLVQGGPTGAQALEVGLTWQGREVTVIATHLQPPSGWRSLDQVEQLADIVRAAPKPAILAGDLNLQPGEAPWQALIAASLTDPFAAVRPFDTIPTPGDPEQIDHILVSPGFRGSDQANPDLPYSDHRAVAVTLRYVPSIDPVID